MIPGLQDLKNNVRHKSNHALAVAFVMPLHLQWPELCSLPLHLH